MDVSVSFKSDVLTVRLRSPESRQGESESEQVGCLIAQLIRLVAVDETGVDDANSTVAHLVIATEPEPSYMPEPFREAWAKVQAAAQEYLDVLRRGT